jgi:hypothetical protein
MKRSFVSLAFAAGRAVMPASSILTTIEADERTGLDRAPRL